MVLRPPPPSRWGPLRTYSRVLPDICKGGSFFAKSKDFRIKCAYKSFYANINAPYAHLIHKISFYLAKNAPNACICEIFVVPLQPILKSTPVWSAKRCRDGGIGRHEGLKILWPVMAVPVRPRLAVLINHLNHFLL